MDLVPGLAATRQNHARSVGSHKNVRTGCFLGAGRRRRCSESFHFRQPGSDVGSAIPMPAAHCSLTFRGTTTLSQTGSFHMHANITRHPHHQREESPPPCRLSLTMLHLQAEQISQKTP